MRLGWPITVVLLAAAAPGGAADALEWRRGELKLKPAGYFQGDLRGFPGWEVDEDETTGTLREDTRDIRRARLGLEAELGDRLSGEVIFDVNELLNSVIPPDDTGTAFSVRRDLRNAYVELALGKDHFLRGGHFKLPVSREFLTSAAKTDFAERSLLANGIAPGRDWGLMLGGELKVARQLRYLVGAFAGDAWGEEIRGGPTGAARLVLELVDGVELGGSVTIGTAEADDEDPIVEPEPKSLRGRSASGWSFFRRVHVDGSRRRVGADTQIARGPITLKAEVLHGYEERLKQGSTFDDLPAISGLGWSASAVWRVLGAKKGGGAPLDLAVRYESLEFDDEGPDEGFAGTGSRARNIRPQSSKALSGGLSFWPKKWARILGNVVLDRYNDELLAPEPGRKGTYVTLIARLQVEVP
jgi:hypothetical protein